MKSRFAVTLGSLLLTAAAAFAQINTVRAEITVAIPFAFRAGDTMLPAGQYEIRSEAGKNVLLIRCPERNASILVPTSDTRYAQPQERGRLMFHQYGENYFLAEAWAPGTSHGRTLQESEPERELARNSARPKPVTIALAAK